MLVEFAKACVHIHYMHYIHTHYIHYKHYMQYIRYMHACIRTYIGAWWQEHPNQSVQLRMLQCLPSGSLEAVCCDGLE